MGPNFLNILITTYFIKMDKTFWTYSTYDIHIQRFDTLDHVSLFLLFLTITLFIVIFFNTEIPYFARNKLMEHLVNLTKG